jgi:hypothetical protein
MSARTTSYQGQAGFGPHHALVIAFSILCISGYLISNHVSCFFARGGVLHTSCILSTEAEPLRDLISQSMRSSEHLIRRGDEHLAEQKQIIRYHRKGVYIEPIERSDCRGLASELLFIDYFPERFIQFSLPA